MRDPMIAENERIRENTQPALAGFVSQFYVFSGETYLGWDCFDSSSVKVGGSAFADLVLDDPDIDDIQAEFRIINGRIKVVNLGREGGLTVNNRAVSESAVGAFDVVKIGKYTVKAKLKKMTGAAMEQDQPSMSIPVSPKEPESPKPDVKVQDVVKAQETASPKEVQVPVKADKTPPIVKNLLSIMDRHDDLDFEDIEEILTTKAADKTTDKTDAKTDEKTAPESHESPQSKTAIGTIKGPVQTNTAKPAEKIKTKQDEAKKRPTPYGLVAETRQEKTVKGSPSDVIVRIKSHPPILKDNASETLINEASSVKSAEKDGKKEQRQLSVSPIEKQEKAKTEQIKAKAPVVVKKDVNTFPVGFFAKPVDDEDEEEDDCPANFTLRDKLTGVDSEAPRRHGGERVLEIIRFKGGNVISISHLKDDDELVLVHGKETFCRVRHNEREGTKMTFSKPLLGTINRIGEKELKADMEKGRFKIGSKTPVYSSLLPVKSEITLTDGFYDYLIRKSVLPPDPVVHDPSVPQIPWQQLILNSTAFKYGSRALIFHIILLFVFSFTVKLPDKSEFKDPETYFVKVDTEDIKKPVKPIPKPKPVLPTPVRNEDLSSKKEIAKKEETKETIKTPEKEQTTPKVAANRSDAPDSGDGKDGNVVNKNVNQVGLLATLGKKTGISLAPNEALASVTNMDAVTSRRGHEANVKVGGIVGNLGDSKIAIPAAGVVNNKGGAGVYRSAGIGGKGSVAALETGKTGKRAVKAVVAAPVAKKVRAAGGGISREAVAKVINDHMDEVNSCYESALVSDSNLMGRVEFEWTILQSGDVGDVRIKSSTVKSSQLHACIISAIKSWKFPKPTGADVVVSYPFVFDITGF